MKKNKLFGFTLAEVLITLTIIGIIAAMTVPTLMSKHQKHTYVVGLKKAYSQLQNGLKMLPLTQDCSSGDYDCAGLFYQNNSGAINIDSLKNVLKVKTFFGTSKTDDKSKEITELYQKVLKVEGNWLEGFILEDGTIMLNSATQTGGFVVDVNGLKGPNKWGRDIFRFYVATQEKNGIAVGTIMPSGSRLYSKYSYNTENGWEYWKNNLHCTSANIKNYHSEAGSSVYPWRCTGRVLEEDAMNY